MLQAATVWVAVDCKKILTEIVKKVVNLASLPPFK